MKVSELKPLEKNPFKSVGDEQIKKIAKSIQEFERMMEIRRIVIDEENNILGGNKRYFALKKLGYKEIPDAWIEKVEGLTEEQKKEFIVKDNAHWGSEWDYELLGEWNVDLDAWGVGDVEFADEKEAKEDDYEIPDEIETDIVLGDLIEIGEHRLLCGDSTDSDSVAKLMNGEKADMVFTDPPYGVSYEGGHNKKKRKGIENDNLQGQDLTDLFYESLMNADLFSKDYSAFYIWYSTNKSVETFASFSRLNLSVRAVIAWYKVKSGLGSFMSQYIPNFEPCIYAFKNGKSPQWFGASDEKSVWELKKDSRNEYHPTQKPIELPSRAIENSSKLKDIIYDCFLGSGSTMVAAHQLNRKCYGMELEPKYCQVIVNRMRNLDSNLVIKKNGIEI